MAIVCVPSACKPAVAKLSYAVRMDVMKEGLFFLPSVDLLAVVRCFLFLVMGSKGDEEKRYMVMKVDKVSK